jgi:6-pyruvoyltetrahydropterin/6-carboxytetrahydropterin synthase
MMPREICSITRVYHFSAGHRLYRKDVSEDENLRIFGKCTNPKGHGHDYYLEVGVRGDIDPDTGMIINIGELDEIAREVIDELDHKRLDIEVLYFTDVQPSGENIVRYFWSKLKPRIKKGKLSSLKLWETQNNYFEYFEEEVL